MVNEAGDIMANNWTREEEIIVFNLYCTQHEVQMNLDELIKKLENHHDALGVDHLVYPALRRLKDLRNRIHLQKLES